MIFLPATRVELPLETDMAGEPGGGTPIGADPAGPVSIAPPGGAPDTGGNCLIMSCSGADWADCEWSPPPKPSCFCRVFKSQVWLTLIKF